MKQNSSPTPRPQPLTPEVLVHIADLAERDDCGLAERCARYRRRASIRRTAVAACLFVGCTVSYALAMAAPMYDQITTTSSQSSQHICGTAIYLIEHIS